MSKKYIPLVVLLCCFLVTILQPVPVSPEEALAAEVQVSAPFVFIDDDAYGRISLENDSIKLVWNYKENSSEYRNRNGGSIYEMYDKRTDPGMNRNLVAVTNYGGGSSTPNHAGIGGLGATHLWELGRSVSSSDVGKYSRLLSKNYYTNPDGTAVFEASFIVSSTLLEYSDQNRPDNYSVDKKWTIYPNGNIKLDISMTILRTFYASEPAYDFSFNRYYGWATASSRYHKWFWWSCGGAGSNGNSNSYNSQITIDNIDVGTDRDYQLLHSENFALYGQSGGVAMRIRMDNDGRGFEGGGIFNFGQEVWGDTANPNVEFSSYNNRANGHTVRYAGWWGGSPPGPERHKLVEAGTSWSDSIWIETVPANTQPTLEIVADVSIDSLGPTMATINWDTNFASDSKVLVWSDINNQISRYIPAWTPSHQISFSDLTPATIYHYEVLSRDGSGEIVKAGSFTTTGLDGVYLDMKQTSAQWLTYNDYVIRKLTVGFDIANIGVEDAVSTRALSVDASMGVTGQLLTNNVGPIVSGGHGQLSIAYFVPSGVNSFMTTVYLSANDGIGNEYFFPDIPVV